MATPARSDVAMLNRPSQVAAALPPLRRRILESLDEPDSATGLARRLGLPRQKINYHLRELEREGLLELAEERQRRGCVERLLRAKARGYLVNPLLLGELSADPAELRDRFSSTYLIAVVSQMAHDVDTLRRRARAVEQQLPTLTLETEVRFARPADLKAFSDELAEAIARLAAKYNRPRVRGARTYRFALGAHPKLTKTAAQARAEASAHASKKKKRRDKP